MRLTLIKIPSDVLTGTSDDFVYVYSDNFKIITGTPAWKNRTRSWRGRVVKVTCKDRSVLRLLRGNGKLPIDSNACWFGNPTRSQLDVEDGAAIEVKVSPPVLGRFLYYWYHTRDEVRSTYRLSIAALFFAVIALVVEIVKK
jgi:hypothetical protein